MQSLNTKPSKTSLLFFSFILLIASVTDAKADKTCTADRDYCVGTTYYVGGEEDALVKATAITVENIVTFRFMTGGRAGQVVNRLPDLSDISTSQCTEDGKFCVGKTYYDDFGGDLAKIIAFIPERQKVFVRFLSGDHSYDKTGTRYVSNLMPFIRNICAGEPKICTGKLYEHRPYKAVIKVVAIGGPENRVLVRFLTGEYAAQTNGDFLLSDFEELRPGQYQKMMAQEQVDRVIRYRRRQQALEAEKLVNGYSYPRSTDSPSHRSSTWTNPYNGLEYTYSSGGSVTVVNPKNGNVVENYSPTYGPGTSRDTPPSNLIPRPRKNR